jgi:hypothetical protein
VLDFLNKPKEEIKDALSELNTNIQGKKPEINDQLILLLSVLFKHRHFQHERKVLLTITEIIKFLSESIGSQVNILSKLYFILPENSQLKGELLMIYFKALISFEGQKEATKEIINDFRKKVDNYEKDELSKIITAISTYIVHTKNYTLFELYICSLKLVIMKLLLNK